MKTINNSTEKIFDAVETEQIVKKWKPSGLLDGFTGEKLKITAQTLEEFAQYILNLVSPDEIVIGKLDVVCFLIIKRIMENQDGKINIGNLYMELYEYIKSIESKWNTDRYDSIYEEWDFVENFTNLYLSKVLKVEEQMDEKDAIKKRMYDLGVTNISKGLCVEFMNWSLKHTEMFKNCWHYEGKEYITDELFDIFIMLPTEAK